MATWNMFSFQDPNSFVSTMLIWLHDFNMMVLTVIMVSISYFMVFYIRSKFPTRMNLHGNNVETMWTVVPVFLLSDMAVPSLKILYFTESDHIYMHTVKTVAHQWYWSYEYTLSDLYFNYDSYMVQLGDMADSGFRMLEVDNRMVMPIQVPFRNVVTSADVIHSWTMPTLGLKIDAIPGRLNQIALYGLRSGVYYGQCSEICGMNHSFMPIVLELTQTDGFYQWVAYIKD